MDARNARFRIFSNFKTYEGLLQDHPRIDHRFIGAEGAWISGIRTAIRALWDADCLLLNVDHSRLLAACAVFGLLAPRPFRRCRLVSVDLLLRPERGPRGRLKRMLKSLLLRQVDTFVLYFKNWDGYVRAYRLPRDRIVYVPFKVNSWERLSRENGDAGAGEYVLCAGATLRDHATFVEAVRESGVPAMLLLPGALRRELELLPWYQRGLPPNLQLEFHDDGKEETYLRYFARASIVCIPRFRWDIASTGISAALCALALKKCLAISRGPGAEDLFEGREAADFFEPEDPTDLAKLLKGLWGNHPRRRKIALNGYRYATELQGEERLLRDLLAVIDFGRAPAAEYA